MARILVVDDSEAIRAQLRRDLGATGHVVVEAENGVKAIDAITKGGGDFDLIVTDLNMPLMDGFTLCKTASEWFDQNGKKRVPIIVLTSDAGVTAKARAKNLSVVAFILKPVNSQKLIAAIDKILGA